MQDHSAPFPAAVLAASAEVSRNAEDGAVEQAASLSDDAPRTALPSASPPLGINLDATSTQPSCAVTYPPHMEEGRAEAMIPGIGVTPARFAVLHPQGFRILNNASAMERNMRGYFRLPPPPNAATKAEQRRLQRTLRQLEREETRRRAGVTANRDGVVLDGFLILSACDAEDPGEVTAVTLQASHLTSSVQDDLQFFTELTTLDVSDNQLRLGDVLPFPHLETLHMVCNCLTSLADVAQSESASLSKLAALDLAYNRIPARDLLYLNAFHALQHLDLSNNALRTLPPDLSSLGQLTHLALEANELSASSVFHALGTLPALVAVNLASNCLSRVPVLRPAEAPLHHTGGSADEHGPLAFPALQMITLSANHFADVDALLPLAALHRNLRHVAVADNPFLTRRPRDAAPHLQRVLDEAVVDLYFTAKDPHPVSPVGHASEEALETAAGTWQSRTWVRYLPSPRQPNLAEAAELKSPRRRPSSVSTAAPAPPTKEDVVSGGALHALPTPPIAPVADAALDLPVEGYLDRYRIRIQCSSRPPPPPKQPKRFFHSAEFRTSQEEGAAVTGPLVTLPPYGEFMDIYRIVGRQSHASQQKAPPRSRRTPQRPSQRATLPVIARRSPPPPLPAAPSIPLPERHDAPYAEAAHREEEEEEESPPEETLEAEDGFFLTSVDSGARRRERKATREGTVHSTVAASTKERGGEEATATAAAAPPRDGATLPLANQSTRTRAPLPRSVVSPASTNVRAAMSELRAMLRKPLPSLPYEPARSRQER